VKGENMPGWFCYRWLPRTVFGNISYAFYVFRRGICNIVKWTPVIWWDIWFDSESIFEILKFKIGDMEKNFKLYGHHVGSDRDAHRMMICRILLDRLIKDDYLKTRYIYMRQQDLDYFCKLFNKNIYSWWD